MVHYFVWYRLGGDPRVARGAVNALLTDIGRDMGVSANLLVRRDDPNTWMEVYEGVTEPVVFERELAAAVLRHDIARFVAEGGRHVEAFVAPG